MPYKTSAGELYDTGEFARVMETSMGKADWQGIARRKAEAKAKGKLRGIGMCYYIESTMGDPTEHAGIQLRARTARSRSWSAPSRTARATRRPTRRSCTAARRAVREDPDRPGRHATRVKAGGGTGGSRSLTAEWTAMNDASDNGGRQGQGLRLAGVRGGRGRHHLQRRHVLGRRHRPDDRHHGAGAEGADDDSVPGMEGGLDADATSQVSAWTFPNGCHIAEVEVDPDTGVAEVVGYNIVDDFGVILNPMLVEGQVHGGVVQGIGQALLERTVYDAQRPAADRLVHGLLHAARRRLPMFDFSTYEVPCANNPMGIKGCGEAGLGRLAGGGDQRDHRRARALRREGGRHAGDGRKGLEPGPTALGSLSVRDLGRRWTAQIAPSFRRHGRNFRPKVPVSGLRSSNKGRSLSP